MKIAIDCRMYSSSGIGTYLQGILPYIIGNKKNTYVLFGKYEELLEYKVDNVIIIHISIPIFSLKELFFFPIEEINKCDRFYSPNFNIPFGINIPIYCCIHDVVFLDENLTSKIGRLVRKYFLKRAMEISEVVFTVSNFSKKQIQKHFGNKKKIVVAPCAVKSNLIKYIPSVNKKREKEYILFVGNIKKHKGLDVLVKAWKTAREKGDERELIIVGKREGFKTKVSDLSIFNEDGILFTGSISDEELYEYITHASFLIQPSKYEGFGLPPLEALYLGTTCIISDIEVFKEIYSDFDNSYFFKQGDEDDLAEKLLKIEPMRIEQKKDIITRFDYEKTAQIILTEIK